MKKTKLMKQEWTQITAEDKAALKTEKARATPSPKLFTLKGDSNNAPCHCEESSNDSIAAGAAESVAFLTHIGFAKPA
jgi:hypothetical protein